VIHGEASLSVAATLARARAALASGDVAQARRWVQRALAGSPSQRERAEAGLCLAESHLVDQQPERAIAGYREVASRFAQLPEGESAAFAAAQVSYERGLRDHAEGALRAYLARYPDGRFAREAEDRLAELAPSHP
jgi:TolA-binding protein